MLELGSDQGVTGANFNEHGKFSPTPTPPVTGGGGTHIPSAADPNALNNKLISRLDDPKLFPDGSTKPIVKPGTTTPGSPGDIDNCVAYSTFLYAVL